VHDYIAKINENPTTARQALDPGEQLVFLLYLFDCRISQCLKHPVAGSRTDNEIISEKGNFMNIKQDDVFPLLFFQGVYNRPGKVKGIQASPRVLYFDCVAGIPSVPAGHA
jgi:hypothetical protein